MGNDVVKMVQNVYRSGIFPRDINRSFIVLIPKIHEASTIKHFRPISLCNTIYKIISKIITDRIKPLLENLISPNKSVFIPERWIAGNIIVANKVVHSMNRKKGFKGLLGIKVDI